MPSQMRLGALKQPTQSAGHAPTGSMTTFSLAALCSRRERALAVCAHMYGQWPHAPRQCCYERCLSGR